MTDEDRELLAHYIARGREPWNGSLEAAWLDYELRRYVLARLPTKRHRRESALDRRAHDRRAHALSVCNVGIGVGLFDDWLGHELGACITSVDRDPDICRIFELRQRREGHPFPARVVCGDVRNGVLGTERFDVICAVGSTLEESGDRGATTRALEAALTPEGVLVVAEVGQGAAADRVQTCGDVWLSCQSRSPSQNNGAPGRPI